jgi:hypothetical protein
MVKKLGVFGPRGELIEAMDADQNGHNGSKASQDARQEQGSLTVGATEWTPEQAEQYIDWRLQNLDSEIAGLRGQLDELIATRKRWLAVTGGRSKMGNGQANGGSNGSGSNGSPAVS